MSEAPSSSSRETLPRRRSASTAKLVPPAEIENPQQATQESTGNKCNVSCNQAWCALLFLLFIGGIGVMYSSKKRNGKSTAMSVLPAYHRCIEMTTHLGQDIVVQGGTLEEWIRDAMKNQKVVAEESSIAFYFACMSKLNVRVGVDRFYLFAEPRTSQNQALDELWAKQDKAWKRSEDFNYSSRPIAIAGFDPSLEYFASRKHADAWEKLQQSWHLSIPGFALLADATVKKQVQPLAGSDYKKFMKDYREFVGDQTELLKVRGLLSFPGFGARVPPSLCQWMPGFCVEGSEIQGKRPMRPIVERGAAGECQGAPCSKDGRAQPPWNDWKDELSDELFVDIMFSLHGAMVQTIEAKNGFGWQIKLEEGSKNCGRKEGTYAVPTAWLAGKEVEENFVEYGVDMFFDKTRTLVAMWDGRGDNPNCYGKPKKGDGTWEELKQVGMAGVLVLHSLVFHAAEKVMYGGTMWTLIYDLPVGHPIRSIMAPFGHHSLEKVHMMQRTLMKNGLFINMTAFTEKGWEEVCEQGFRIVAEANSGKIGPLDTGSSDWFAKRGLEEAKLPLDTWGSKVRQLQMDFVMKSLEEWKVLGNPAMDPHVRALRRKYRKTFNIEPYTLLTLDNHTLLATWMSELLYRQSVTHTHMQHHAICHSTMANGRRFPMQLEKLGNRGVYAPSKDRHEASSILWDMMTEPAPRLTFALDEVGNIEGSADTSGAFRHVTPILKGGISVNVAKAYKKYKGGLEALEEEVHEANKARCEVEKNTICDLYSCVMPSELSLSYGV